MIAGVTLVMNPGLDTMKQGIDLQMVPGLDSILSGITHPTEGMIPGLNAMKQGIDIQMVPGLDTILGGINHPSEGMIFGLNQMKQGIDIQMIPGLDQILGGLTHPTNGMIAGLNTMLGGANDAYSGLELGNSLLVAGDNSAGPGADSDALYDINFLQTQTGADVPAHPLYPVFEGAKAKVQGASLEAMGFQHTQKVKNLFSV